MTETEKLLRLSLIVDPKYYQIIMDMIDNGMNIKDISKIVNIKKTRLKKRHIKTK